MSFNVTKCAGMSLSTRKVLQHDYIMNDQLIPRVQKHDYLGVTISSSLTWKDQCTKVANKAKRTLGLIKRTLHATDRSVRKTAYEMLVRHPVRSPLEYVMCPWSPHTQKDKQCLKNIKRTAPRFMCSDYGKRSSVIQMMDQLRWGRLATRQ